MFFLDYTPNPNKIKKMKKEERLKITPENARKMLEIAEKKELTISFEAEFLLKRISKMETEKNFIKQPKLNQVSLYDLKELQKIIN